MGQILHPRARTTAEVRRAIQNSQESLIKLSNPYHPQTNGQVERTIKEATTKTYHYETVDQLKKHLSKKH